MKTSIVQTQLSDLHPPVAGSHHSAQRHVALPPARTTTTPNVGPIETLDDLFALARDFADHFAHQTNDLIPALFLTGPQGAYMAMPREFARLGEQYGYDRTAQLMCLAHGATACVVVLGVSMSPESADPNPADPSSLTTDLESEEWVMLFGQDGSGIHPCFHSVIRSENGRFFGLGESRLATNGQCDGFPPVLGSVPPTAQDCQRAQEILHAKGAKLIPLIRQATL